MGARYSEPRANRLSMLAGLLGVSVMWLLHGEGDGVEHSDKETQVPPKSMIYYLK